MPCEFIFTLMQKSGWRSGANEEEVRATMERGEQFKARFGRMGFRRNFPFNKERRGKFFATKQVELYAMQENDAWVVITVLTRFF